MDGERVAEQPPQGRGVYVVMRDYAPAIKGQNWPSNQSVRRVGM